jgi:hypothetical protein
MLSAEDISYVAWVRSSLNVFALGNMAIVAAPQTPGAAPK